MRRFIEDHFMPQVGKCKLTGDVGKFVKSHILPRAFVDKNLDKIERIEYGFDCSRPKLVKTGWYDEEIVTRKGEDILERYDSDAAHILRKNGLCWRWFPIAENAERHLIDADSGLEIIRVNDVDTRKLRLFFLSLLWRSVVCRRVGFEQMRLGVLHREKLRKIVSGEIEGHLSDFPVVLVLLTTKGGPQNKSPYKDTIRHSPELGLKLRPIPIFRFFLDGLIAHMGKTPADAATFDAWKPRVVGIDSGLTIIGRKYEGSTQEDMIKAMQDQVHEIWPDDARRIYGALERHG
jgi:hypothetical protein